MAAAAGLLALAPACSSGSEAGSTKTSDDKLKIVTAFYPLQYAAQQVAGDKAEVTSLTQPGAEPHDLELTPKQIASLSDADVVVYQKGFQSTVDKAVEQAKPKHVVDVSTLVTMIPSTETEEEGHDHEAQAHASESADAHASESADAHASEEAEGHDHEHEHGGTDPHQWLDPKNMVSITQGIEKQLAEVDSADAEAYKSGAATAVKNLEALDNDFRAGLKNCQRKEFITSHAAFSYLAKEYGLTQIGISGLSPDDEPSPARVAEVQKLAKQHGVTTIFYETLVSPAQAKAIAGDLGLKTDVLDPLEGITKESRGSDYIAVQKANLKALQTANGCQ
ncbi:zinc ABC transporter substrate-binding protein [Luteococcus peritonei]